MANGNVVSQQNGKTHKFQRLLGIHYFQNFALLSLLLLLSISLCLLLFLFFHSHFSFARKQKKHLFPNVVRCFSFKIFAWLMCLCSIKLFRFGISSQHQCRCRCCHCYESYVALAVLYQFCCYFHRIGFSLIQFQNVA